MTAQPILKEITIKEWGVTTSTTDAGSLDAMVRAHKYFRTCPRPRRAQSSGHQPVSRRHYKVNVTQALEKKLDHHGRDRGGIRGSFRVMISSEMLDPPEMVSYTKIKDGPEPWTRTKTRRWRTR